MAAYTVSVEQRHSLRFLSMLSDILVLEPEVEIRLHLFILILEHEEMHLAQQFP